MIIPRLYSALKTWFYQTSAALLLHLAGIGEIASGKFNGEVVIMSSPQNVADFLVQDYRYNSIAT